MGSERSLYVTLQHLQHETASKHLFAHKMIINKTMKTEVINEPYMACMYSLNSFLIGKIGGLLAPGPLGSIVSVPSDDLISQLEFK